ncbi:DMT family transporter [Legionella lansingensis]|uniref:DMT family transporter n=1 Tax=Legionella lansingensis TaxID=45067 RepID=UPI001E585CB8|nr:DMT family transporter [Legionella lansingensis]
MNSQTLRALLLLTLLGFIWGSGYTLAKYAMTNGVSPLGYAFWQSCGPALLLTGLCLLSGNGPFLNLRYWPYFLICGLIGITIPNTNMYFIASHIPAGLLAVLVNTVPLFVYPMALFAKQEHYDGWRVLAIMIGLIGILMIIDPTMQGLLSSWSLLALISPFGFALCSIYITAKQPSALNALRGASGMLIASSLLLLPLVLQQHAFYPLTLPLSTPQQVVILEIILSSIGYLLFFKLLSMAGPVFYSLTGGIVALTGLFWDFVVFDALPDKTRALASLLIIFALFLLSWRQSRQLQEAR